MTTPFFSIIIPAYNAGIYLEYCLNSVLKQNFTDFELIIINDGSTDNTKNICEEYLNNDKRIIFIDSKNEGAYSARNKGIRLAKGNHVLFVDSDDILAENALTIIFSYLHKYNVDLLVYGMKRFKQDTEIVPAISNSLPKIINDKSKAILKLITDSSYNSLCRKVFRRDFLMNVIKNLDFRIDFGEDLLLSMDVYLNCENFLFSEEILYYYRYNENSMTNNVSIAEVEKIFYVRKVILNKIIENKLFNKSQMLIYYNYSYSIIIENFISICKYKMSIKEKKIMISQMLNDDYFKLINKKIEPKNLRISYKIFRYLLINRKISMFLLFSQVLNYVRKKRLVYSLS